MIQAPAFFGLLLTLAYVLGAIPFSVMVCRAKGVDLTRVGSGNVGASNVYRALGGWYAFLVLFLDIAKGVLPTYLAMQAFASPVIHVLVGITTMFGHTCSLFLGFKGGKGVATTAGVFAVLTPLPLGIVAALAVALIAWTRRVSVGTLTAAVVFPILLYAYDAPVGLVMVVAGVASFIIWRHRGNIRRLMAGTENNI